MPHSHTRTQQNTALDGIRGFAALLVLLVHFNSNLNVFFTATPALTWAAEILGGFGRAGVGIFYTMTGYFIYAQLMSKEQPYFQFVRRRIRRIYPVFFAVFCLYLALFAIVPSVNKLKGLSASEIATIVVQNLTFFAGLLQKPMVVTVSWTLSYIVLFYLTAPIFVKVFRLKTIGKRPALGVLIVAWLAYGATCVWWDASPRPLMFFTGMILYQVSDSRLTAVPKKRWELLVFVAVALALVFSWIYYSHRAWLYLPFTPRLIRQIVISAALVPFFIYTIYHHHGLVFKTMSFKPLVQLGKLSYSWYLIQGIALYAMTFGLSFLHVKQLSYAGFLGTLLGTIGLNAVFAYVLYHLIEKPFSIVVKKPVGAAPGAEIVAFPNAQQSAAAGKN
jgi:exopolysaccharide production protein ExoZ